MATVTAWSPSIRGLRLGQLVEVEVNGTAEYGQIVAWHPEEAELEVSLLASGKNLRFDPQLIRSADDVRPPGKSGDPSGFDIVLGPQTDRGAVSQVLANCLTERGFCVLRIIQDESQRDDSCSILRQCDQGGRLGRLANELEEGYLGKNGRAKVMWIDPDDSTFSDSSIIVRNDGNITSLAEILQPFAEDVLGAAISERTPALACMSMTDSDEAEFDNPRATDKMIEEFYSSWARTLVRVTHYMGPAAGKATLSLKAGAPIDDVEFSYEITASPNTILLWRQDTFNYSFMEPIRGQAFWLQSFFMRVGPQYTLGEFEGDPSTLRTTSLVGDGPPPPKESHVAVVAIAIQSCGSMTDHHKEWAAYLAGCDGQLEMPFTRFDYLPYYNEEVDNPQGSTYVRHFSVQDGVELFDNKVFEISNMEAECMDPQCRQLMEVGYLCVQQLGMTKKFTNTNATHASVSVGCDKQEWLMMPVNRSVATNNQLAISANRFNYVFNLKGGSYVCDTACSSSLVALHLGKVNLCEKRWDPLEWHMGMGVSMTLTVGSFIHGCAAHMLSNHGRCLTFNASANGYNRGDGTAGMIIKCGTNDELRMAYCRGTQIGQDGRSASMSAPNGPAQEKCVWGATREAQMTPPESTVWECHGTGTSLGDPIEVGAVRKVQIKMKREEPLMIATSKSNFGHLEGSAAAMAMNKCVLVVMRTISCATLHLKTLNPHLDHAAFEAFFTTEHTPYKYRRGHCQVSSFGVGGTNGHAIFWGEKAEEEVDFRKLLLRKLMKAPPPIIAQGTDPSNWEYNGIDLCSKQGDNYRIMIQTDPVTGEENILFEKQIDLEEPAGFYSTTGSHNDWGDDQMNEGDVPGLYFQDIEMPDNGVLEFRILAEGDQERAIGPNQTTYSKTAPMQGPDPELRTSWMVRGKPRSVMRVEFFSPMKKNGQHTRSITWIPMSR